jgi:long-chain fatty acid transport protein
MNTKLRNIIAMALVAGAVTPVTVLASNGYFSFGWGTKSKAMAGVAAALPQDTLVAATNPAGMALIDTSLDLGVAFFSPSARGYEADNNFSTNAMGFPTTGFLTPGEYDSSSDWFLVPSFGYNRVLNDQMTLGVSVFGNGGMNTDYRNRPVWENFAGAPNQLAIGPGMTPPPGTIAAPNGMLFSMGPDGRPVPVTNPNATPQQGNVNPGGIFSATTPTGINLEQLFIEVPFTYKVNGQHSLGIAPVFAVQSFEAKGLEPFRQMSFHPEAVSNNGKDWSYGFGVHVGWVGEITDALTLGASYRSKLWMTEFDDYKGLFAENGDFDIPAMLNLGLSFKVRPDLVLAFDWQRIFYNEIAAVGNSNNVNVMPCMMPGSKPSYCLGGNDGLGFGWKDMDVFKLGARWDYSDKFSFMAGASHASDFTSSDEVLLNIMAPATIQWTFTLGGTYRHSATDSFNLSLAYMPNADFDGNNPSITGSQTYNLYMEQKDIEISWNHRF